MKNTEIVMAHSTQSILVKYMELLLVFLQWSWKPPGSGFSCFFPISVLVMSLFCHGFFPLWWLSSLCSRECLMPWKLWNVSLFKDAHDTFKQWDFFDALKFFVSFSKGHGPQCQKVLQLNYIWIHFEHCHIHSYYHTLFWFYFSPL